MELIDVEHVPSKGGSLRCTVQHAQGLRSVDPSVAEFIAQEDELGIYDTAFYQPCRNQILSVRDELKSALCELKEQGHTFAGYGTSIGATILIYQLELGEYLQFLVDDDPYRQNLVSPGYHIPVVSPETLSQDKPSYTLILAPLYAEQIMAKNSGYADSGGHFIKIWPTVEIC
jgi:hypothetical protein